MHGEPGNGLLVLSRAGLQGENGTWMLMKAEGWMAEYPWCWIKCKHHRNEETKADLMDLPLKSIPNQCPSDRLFGVAEPTFQDSCTAVRHLFDP